MSTATRHHQTEPIVSILDLYHRNGDNMHFLFEDGLISLKQFLLKIIPSVMEIKWSLDKEDIACLWNFLYILHTDVSKVGYEFGMHFGTALGCSEEVLLHPSFLTDVLGKKDGCALPLAWNLLFDP